MAFKRLDMYKDKLKSWTGLGDYDLTSNSLVNRVGPDQIVTRGPLAGTNFTYREYLGDVFTHPDTVGAMNLISYRINPASAHTFPWLSRVAPNWDKWRANGILFEFKSTCSNYSADSAVGSILMATEYDVLDPPYSTKRQMLNAAYANETRMDKNVVHGIECAPSTMPHDIFYVLGDDEELPPGGNARDYSLGTFYMGTSGGSLPVNTNVGSLWIHYDMYFQTEQLLAPGIGPVGGLLLPMYYAGLMPTVIGGYQNFSGFTRHGGQDLGITCGLACGVTFPVSSILAGRVYFIEITVSADAGAPSWISGTPYPSFAITGAGATIRQSSFSLTPSSTTLCAVGAAATGLGAVGMNVQMMVSLPSTMTEPVTLSYPNANWPSADAAIDSPGGSRGAIRIVNVESSWVLPL